MKRKKFLIGIDACKVSHLKSVKFSKIKVAFLKGIKFFHKNSRKSNNEIMKSKLQIFYVDPLGYLYFHRLLFPAFVVPLFWSCCCHCFWFIASSGIWLGFSFWNVLEHFPCARVCERVPTVSASIRIRYGGHLLYITALVTRNRKQ